MEETVLAIDEYIHFTSANTYESAIGIDRLSSESKISDGMRDVFHELKDEADDEGKVLAGQLNIIDMAVWEYTADEFGYFGFCLEYQDWAVSTRQLALPKMGRSRPHRNCSWPSFKPFQ